MTPQTLAFDVYGTLINTDDISKQLHSLIGDKASAVSTTWRDKQLEYSFRRGLMNDFVPFSVCTQQALDYAIQNHDVDLSANDKTSLLKSYKTLPTFDDVKAGLEQCQSQGHRLYAFSNGNEDDLQSLLSNAGIIDLFDGVVSVVPTKTFKPSPVVYAHFLEKTQSDADNTWLVSSNSFDILGANHAKWQTIWIQREKSKLLDPWEKLPTKVVNKLTEIKV